MSESLGVPAEFNVSQANGVLSEEIAQTAGVATYIAGLEAYYDGTQAVDMLKTLACTVEPVDPLTGTIADGAPAATSFLQGALLGLRAVELAYGADMILALSGENVVLRVPGKDSDDTRDRWTKVTDVVVAMGNEGLGFVEGMHDQLDEWDLQATKDVTMVPHFRRGFGFAIVISKRYRDQLELENFTAFMEALGVQPADFSSVFDEF